MVSAFGGAAEGAAFGMEEAGVSEIAAATAATGAAVRTDPVVDFARATGVLSSPFVEAITGPGAVVDFAALEAGAPASGFLGGVGLKESRIFFAAPGSWERMCGICLKTVFP